VCDIFRMAAEKEGFISGSIQLIALNPSLPFRFGVSRLGARLLYSPTESIGFLLAGLSEAAYLFDLLVSFLN
jgi:hypothetical protein